LEETGVSAVEEGEEEGGISWCEAALEEEEVNQLFAENFECDGESSFFPPSFLEAAISSFFSSFPASSSSPSPSASFETSGNVALCESNEFSFACCCSRA
jgi:hypothetical protein